MEDSLVITAFISAILNLILIVVILQMNTNIKDIFKVLKEFHFDKFPSSGLYKKKE